MSQWQAKREMRLADEALQRELSATREANDLVATLDVDGFLLSLNLAGYRLLGLPLDAALPGFRIHQFYDDDSRSAFTRSDLPAALRDRVCQSERNLLTCSGLRIPCRQTLVMHHDEDGAPAWFSLIAHDISSLRAAEAERQALREELFQARKLELLGSLAGGIAHDFNNFLTVIMGHAELGLMNPSADAGLRKDLQLILDTSQRAARLTAQLRDYSSRRLIEPELLDLNTILDDSRPVLTSMLGASISLQYEQEPDLWPIRFDRTQLEQILFNLALNARDAMDGRGTLSMRTSNVPGASGTDRDTGKHVQLSVCDSGCGMTPEVMARIFDPFYTTKQRGKGSGLGLAAVFGAVKQNGSDIHVSSTPGAGSCFDVLIPVHEALPDDLPQ